MTDGTNTDGQPETVVADDDGPWVRGAASGGGATRALHTDRDCWRLQRANRIRPATDRERNQLSECNGYDCTGRDRSPGTGDGHLQSLRDAANPGGDA